MAPMSPRCTFPSFIMGRTGWGYIPLILTIPFFWNPNILGSENGSASSLHKVQVSDPAIAADLVSSGARLIADYGSFQIFQSVSVPKNVLRKPQIELRDEFNLIHLNAGTLDTGKAETQALRRNVGAFEGKRLHLLHFGGPILPVWQQELLAT